MSKIDEFPELTALADDDLLLAWNTTTRTTSKVKMSTLKSFLGTASAPVPNQNQLTYSTDGDTGGLCYFLGTNKGTAPWQNPHPTKIILSSSGVGAGSTDMLTDRQPSPFYTLNAPDGYVKLAIADGLLKCNYYSMRNRSDDGHYVRNWKLQGSTNDATWVDLDSQVNNQTLNTPSQWLSLPVSSTTAYKYFRIITTGVNSLGYNYFCIGELELYGTYTF